MEDVFKEVRGYMNFKKRIRDFRKCVQVETIPMLT
jgi:hypothetical protein